MIYIVRHGETQWNAEGRIQGRQDIELNEKGRQMERSCKGTGRPPLSGDDHVPISESKGIRSDPGTVGRDRRSAGR